MRHYLSHVAHVESHLSRRTNRNSATLRLYDRKIIIYSIPDTVPVLTDSYHQSNERSFETNEITLLSHGNSVINDPKHLGLYNFPST